MPSTNPNLLESEQLDRNLWLLTSDQPLSLQIHVLTNHIIRFRWQPGPRDFSYAIDPSFNPEDVAVKQRESQSHWTLQTSGFICEIAKDGMSISLYDLDRKLIVEDEQTFHQEDEAVACAKKIANGEAFFGLGDKADEFNLRGKTFTNWGTDAFYYQKGSDPLYRNIPFYIGLQASGAYGIFLDNSHRTHFDFGNSDPSLLKMSADGGELNYYFIYGPGIQEVSERYAQLTGRPELPPLWGLGYHQCKWSYYPESNVRDVAAKFRELEIPCDAIYLDIDYMDDYRCFTWDQEGFPHPKKMIADLREQGFKTVVILDPGIKIDPDYSVYQEGTKGDYFCKTRDGKLFEGKVWPGPCHFPDFTKADTRKWWGGQVKTLVDAGVAGIWNDMNEPSVFDTDVNTMPAEVVHDYEGENAPHAKAHNIYGMQMARSTYEGLRQWRASHRPFVITRSGYSGMQRYTLAWTGDNTSNWEHLWLASIQCQRMSLSGVSYIGTDIGGFVKDSDPELFVRWIQLGAFHPLFRTHSMADKADMAPNLSEELREAIRGGANREPWAFGEEKGAVIKKYISLRYRLLPYLYTAFWQYVQRGTPVLRPLVMLDQDHGYFTENAENFAVGDHLVVAPVVRSQAQNIELQLPQGQWYHYWTDQRYSGRILLQVAVQLEDMPIFVRAGAVVPSQPLMQYALEKPIEQMSLDVYFAEEEIVSHLYEDAGEGYDYQQGQHKQKNFAVAGSKNSLQISQEFKGSYQPEYPTYLLRVHGLPFQAKEVVIDGKSQSWQTEGKVLSLVVSESFQKISIT